MNSRFWIVAVASSLALMGLGFGLWRLLSRDTATLSTNAPGPNEDTSDDEDPGIGPLQRPTHRGSSWRRRGPRADNKRKAQDRFSQRRRIGRANRRRLLARIIRAVDHGGPGQRQAVTEARPATRKLDLDYVSRQLKEIMPMMRQCYQNELALNKQAKGDLEVQFTLIADAELGGLVEEAKIIGGTISHKGGLAECVRETTYAVRLAAPEAGGRVTVRYPIKFRHNGVAESKTQGRAPRGLTR